MTTTTTRCRIPVRSYVILQNWPIGHERVLHYWSRDGGLRYKDCWWAINNGWLEACRWQEVSYSDKPIATHWTRRRELPEMTFGKPRKGSVMPWTEQEHYYHVLTSPIHIQRLFMLEMAQNNLAEAALICRLLPDLKTAAALNRGRKLLVGMTQGPAFVSYGYDTYLSGAHRYVKSFLQACATIMLWPYGSPDQMAYRAIAPDDHAGYIQHAHDLNCDEPIKMVNATTREHRKMLETALRLAAKVAL